jgi:hypothetical protein
VRLAREVLGPELWDSLPDAVRSPSRTIPQGVVRELRIGG